MKLGRIFARQMCPLIWRLGVTLLLMRGSLVSTMAQARADWPRSFGATIRTPV
jgi:hypothetical protein